MYCPLHLGFPEFGKLSPIMSTLSFSALYITLHWDNENKTQCRVLKL